jgi:hypothetical protein
MREPVVVLPQFKLMFFDKIGLMWETNLPKMGKYLTR